MRVGTLALVLAVLASPSLAIGIRAPAEVVSVYDGDTFTAKVMIWPSITWRNNVRMAGVDTPGIRGKCEEEKRLAVAARNFSRKLLIGKVVTLTDIKHGKYARTILATVLLPDGRNLADVLTARGYGRTYDGGKRKGWC